MSKQAKNPSHMKIGIVCPYDIFKGGGVQEVVLALHQGLIKRGHDSRIITPLPPSYDGSLQGHIIFIGASRDIKSPFKTTGQISVSLNTDDITSKLAKEKFDLLHFHEPWVPIMSRQLLSRSNSINVATFHAKLPETIVSKTIERVVTPYTKSIMKYLDNLSAVSSAAADYVSSLTKENISIIPNGIDLAKYQSAETRSQMLGKKTTGSKLKTPNSKSPKTILFIGRLEKRKGVKYLIRTFAEVTKRQPNAKLVIAGNGPEREKLEELVRTRHIKGVKFLGYVGESKKLELLAGADLFCSPALFGESFGIVLLEAMATGLVTVAGNNPGYSSVLTGYGAISLVDPKNKTEFAAKLEDLLTNQATRERWRLWAAKEVQKYGYEKVVDQYIAFYKASLKK